MRDDTITLSGPFPIPNFFIDTYTDDDGEVVPAHTVDMSDVRRFVVETKVCSCDNVHGASVEVSWSLMCEHRVLLEHTIDALYYRLRTSMCAGPTPEGGA